MKYAIDVKVTEKVKGVVSEMIAEVIPMDREVYLHVDFSEKKGRVYITFYYKNRTESILAGDEVIATFEERVKPYCLTVHDEVDGDNRFLRLKIKGNR